MTLVQLRHLIALADQASFSRAAQAVHLSQPAFSRSIRALEVELQLPLLDRIGRRIEWTVHGRETLERAMLMLALLQKACRDHRQLRLEITRSGTELLVQSLRAKALDGLVVDARSLKPAPDLRTEFAEDLAGDMGAPPLITSCKARCSTSGASSLSR